MLSFFIKVVKSIKNAVLNDEMSKQLKVCDSLFRDVANFIVFNQIPGDYFEFGVYKGHGLIRMSYWINENWRDYLNISNEKGFTERVDLEFVSKKTFFAFDSFEGLPRSGDFDRPAHFYRGAYAAQETEFWENVNMSKSSPEKIKLIQGWFEDTLCDETKIKNDIGKASIIFIDCDLAESASKIMPFISDIIQQGTVIIIDDYYRYMGKQNKGVRGVFNEWIDSQTKFYVEELVRCSANRVAFLCHCDIV